VLPVEGANWRTTEQGFGAPRDGGARKHLGLDLFGNAGAPVRAAHAGVAVLVDNSDNSTAGLTVYIRGDDGFVTVYMHNSRNVVKQGARVAAGEVIAAVGTTGNATRTAPHVHFEVHDRGQLSGGQIDPRPWLFERGVR
jgi:murein DD-endopeptidase MepM/ murein hydrolase activator NlpD